MAVTTVPLQRTRGWSLGLAAALLPACLPGAFDDLAGREPGAAMDASSESPGDAAAQRDAAPDSAAPGGGAQDAGDSDAGPRTLSLAITRDEDDALFCRRGGTLDEFLHFSEADGAAGFTIEVGTDGEDCRTGLRFVLPVERGARIESATLSLRRVGPESNVEASATMRVQVFEGGSVPPFDDSHQHDVHAQHGPAGLWPTWVGGWVVGPTNAITTSPDLSSLVQHVVDGASWQPDAVVTFLLSPDGMADDRYAQFFDSAMSEYPPVLTLSVR